MKRTGIFLKITKIGYIKFVRIVICIVCAVLMVYLTHFCIESNKVQTHEFDFSWLASDTLLLDSVSVSIEYPEIGANMKNNHLQIRVSYFMKGNRLSHSSLKKYYLRDGNLVDSIAGILDLNIKALADEKEQLVKSVYIDFSDIPEFAVKHIYHQHLIAPKDSITSSIFFAKSEVATFPERFIVTNIYYGNFNANIFSPFNLQKRCIKIRMDTLRKSNLTINFNAPFIISDFTHEPDAKEFRKLHFNERKTLEKIYVAKGSSATFDILPYEGLQTTRNIFIGIVIPMLISCIYYQLKHLKRNIQK